MDSWTLGEITSGVDAVAVSHMLRSELAVRRRLPLKAVLIALALVALPARGDGPVLHEYFEPSPAEDLALSATTSSGNMPAAIETESGVVGAPDATRPPAPTEVPYGGRSTVDSADASYQIDSDTTRPDVVDYDDPFIPAVTPFKRLYAHDRVDPSLELVVGDKKLSPVSIGTAPVRAGDDQFYGDILVDLVPDTPVRIPTVGPGSRLITAHTYPSTEFSIWRDGADNWFIKSRDKLRVRLIVQLAISRAVFGSEFPDVAWEDLARDVPPLPASIRPAAEEVIAELGITRSSPRAALLQLVSHFRSFAPSSDRPRSAGTALYKELAISKKGVCRHRAYAFVITAHALGLPARMIRNEAHAWVEVSDGVIWHRIDLGGAAGDLESQQDPSLPQHQPPTDPYRWPEGTQGTESGSALANRSLRESATEPESDPNDPTATPSASALAPAPLGPAALDAGAPLQNDSRPASTLSVRVEGSDVRRGEPVRVSGRVTVDGEGCSRVRVDFGLAGSDGRVTPIQAMSTDGEGRYAGAIVVPLHIDVGDYRVVVSTPGGGRCGRGSVE